MHEKNRAFPSDQKMICGVKQCVRGSSIYPLPFVLRVLLDQPSNVKHVVELEDEMTQCYTT